MRVRSRVRVNSETCMGKLRHSEMLNTFFTYSTSPGTLLTSSGVDPVGVQVCLNPGQS